MTITEMLKQSAVLTALGMTVVFAFLWLMIICVNAAAALVRRMGWDKDITQPPAAPSAQKKQGPEITAAITAAVAEYRGKEEDRHE
jgi:oxaloacetate decarboxylase gamma subunit